MNYKHLYAYGHKLVFNFSNKISESSTISINETSTLSLTSFSHKIFFNTNQGREIYLCSQYNLDDVKNEWAFVVKECVTFLCDIEKKSICYKKEENFSQDIMEYWLIHIVLPLFFTLENRYYFFHTGSVVVNDAAVLFMGDSYAGKSTLTDFFLKKEHALLSDDKLATFYDDEENSFLVHASHPYHRPYRAKEDLGKKAKYFYEKSYDISKVYWIDPVGKDEEISIQELRGIKKFECLRYSTEMDIALNSRERFEYISKFANSIRLYEIKIPNDLERLDEVYKKIIEHIEEEDVK